MIALGGAGWLFRAPNKRGQAPRENVPMRSKTLMALGASPLLLAVLKCHARCQPLHQFLSQPPQRMRNEGFYRKGLEADVRFAIASGEVDRPAAAAYRWIDVLSCCASFDASPS